MRSKTTANGRRITTRGLVTGLLLLAMTPTLATAKPSVSLTLPSVVDAGAAIPFSWGSYGAPVGSRLVLQRQQGTAGVWRSVSGLTGPSGTGQLPGLGIGTYRLRVANLRRRNKVRAQQSRPLAAFGNVPFSTLFGTGRSGVYSMPDRAFAYVLNFYMGGRGSEPAFTVSQNRCRSVHMDFVPGHDFDQTGMTATVSVVQQSLDPVTVTTPYNTVASLDAALVRGQAWSVLLSQTPGNAFDIYVNGFASCSSVAPFR